ncbi:MAG: MCP four helix bundle domain-containing protein, partial [Achromobacter piechaudii]
MFSRFSLGNLSIGTRLTLGFGTVLALLLALTGLSQYELTHIGGINRAITLQTWAKANAINTIDVTTRANARANLELIVNTDPRAADALFARIDANKKVIDQALDVLRPLFQTEDDRLKLRLLEDVRGRYVASFQKVGALLKNGERDAARQSLLDETLPLLDTLQNRVIEISRIQSA